MKYDGITRRISNSTVPLPQRYGYGAMNNYVRFGRICHPDTFGAIKTDYSREGEHIYAVPIPCTGFSATNVMFGNDKIYLGVDGKFYTSPLPVNKRHWKIALILRGRTIPEFGKEADEFYYNLENLLHAQRYATVVLGMTHDIPKLKYDAVIGHSYSASRIHEAKAKIAIAMGDWREGSINHPQDTATTSRGVVSRFHYVINDDMKRQLTHRLAMA